MPAEAVPFLIQDQTLTPRFRLVKALGRGGMGEVWCAWDEELQDQVALKVIRPELARRPGLVDLLKNECRNARRLVHPNIVRVYDFHRAAEHAFISMEYIDGYDLGRLRGAMPGVVLQALLPVLDALAYAHGLSIIHRDVKASNVLLDPAGMPRLVDFGIAAALDAGGPTLRTGGSPRSMSPQQRAGELPSPADDIYACGALLRELLGLDLPAAGGPPTDSRTTPELAVIVGQCLADAPRDRPPSMKALKQMLAPMAASGPNTTLPPAGTGSSPAEQAEPKPPAALKPRPGRHAAPPPAPDRHVSRRKTVPARIIAPVFLVLMAAALIVFLWLPDYTAEHRPRSAPEEAAAEPVEHPAEPAAPPESSRVGGEAAGAPIATQETSREERRAADEALATFLKALAPLEARGVALWGGEDYAAVKALAAEGDAGFRGGDHVLAGARYRQATALLPRLAGRTGAVLAGALSDGAGALEAGDGDAARTAFRVALAIEPENAEARRGMDRAEKVEKVFRLLEAGQDHENQGRLALAHTDYQAAVSLDPYSATAQAAVARIKQAIAEDKFRSAMSQGLQALEQGDYQAALAAFRVAHTFQPDSQEVNDGIAQAKEGIRLAQIAGHRRRARALEKKERWADAAAQYRAALAIDPTLAFAQEGKTRSLRRAELTAQMQHYLNDPSLLTSPRARDQAAALMGRAAAVEPKGPEFSAQLAALKEQFELAARPLTLELRSDDATEVVIYRIGRLGRFKNRQLSLRPGTYTIVGSRPGYKDVRREVRLVAGQRVPPLFIACEEAI